MDKKQLPFWLIAIASFIVLIVPALIKDGMFMDGLLYTCVSKNLADGIGNFWFPHFSKTLHTFFHEQPPLTFGIQAIFFKILGDSIYVERFYSFLTACISGYFITLIWKEVFHNETELKKLSWLPFFYWIIIPVCFWAYSNNMEENTMGIFTLFSSYLIIKGLNSKYNIIIYLIFSGLLIFLGTLCKGFPGLFPIVIVGIYWIIYRKFPFLKMLGYSLILVLVPALLYFIILFNDKIYESLSVYLFGRVINSIQSVSNVNTRFYIIQKLCMELLPVIIMNIILFIVFKLNAVNFDKIKSYIKPALLFILIGISASFPLIVTREQRGFYLLPSLPFYAIGIAIIVAPGINELIKKINTDKFSFKIYKIISVVLLVSVITFSIFQTGKIKRDKDKIHDIHLIGKVVHKGSIIGIEPCLRSDWSLHGYFVRHYYISLGIGQYNYFLKEKYSKTSVDKEYKKIPLESKKYDLYKTNNNILEKIRE